ANKSYKDIAEFLGVSEVQARKYYSRSTKK
ncbi:MAG: hypothetical protein HC787_06715, partial [Nostocaceae cyanobacterium CSU_2_110]|nr:hypothetical protein [Nostocaceae cyanobacterium CSU_2_110]